MFGISKQRKLKYNEILLATKGTRLTRIWRIQKKVKSDLGVIIPQDDDDSNIGAFVEFGKLCTVKFFFLLVKDIYLITLR